jgi:hypothetical protein
VVQGGSMIAQLPDIFCKGTSSERGSTLSEEVDRLVADIGVTMKMKMYVGGMYSYAWPRIELHCSADTARSFGHALWELGEPQEKGVIAARELRLLYALADHTSEEGVYRLLATAIGPSFSEAHQNYLSQKGKLNALFQPIHVTPGPIAVILRDALVTQNESPTIAMATSDFAAMCSWIHIYSYRTNNPTFKAMEQVFDQKFWPEYFSPPTPKRFDMKDYSNTSSH